MDGTQQISANRRDVMKAAGGAAATAAVGYPLAGSAAAAHDADEYYGIKVNQVGYPADGHKMAIANSHAMDVSSVSSFDVVDAETGSTVDSFDVDGPYQDEAGTTQDVLWLDFTDVTDAGTYRLEAGDHQSPEFQIGEPSDIYAGLLRDIGRLYTLKRSNTEIDDPHTGLSWDAGHTQDEEAIVAQPNGSGDWLSGVEPGDTVDISHGWYDAGDYGKYINPGAISVAQLMLAYERNPDAFHVGQFYSEDALANPQDEDWGDLPDVLVECKEELRFLEEMQMDNGALFYKIAAKEWPADDELPADDQRDRYVFGTSSAGTAMACGAFAMAARVYDDAGKPQFAQRMLENAEAAFEWLDNNPEVVWEQSDGQDDGSGAYARPDTDAADRYWAAAELLRTTGDDSYDQWILDQNFEYVPYEGADPMPLPGNVEGPIDWNNPVGLGNYAYFWAGGERAGEGPNAHEEDDTAIAGLNGPFWVNLRYVDSADADAADRWTTGVYEYYWGWAKSGVSRALQGLWAIEAHEEVGNDWINDQDAELIPGPFHHALGRSPTGYSLVTGHGEKSTTDPHDRIIHGLRQNGEEDALIPGMLVGGPQTSDLGEEGDCTGDHVDSGTEPLMGYTDQHCSFATNEWAINYTAPIFMMTAELVGTIESTPEPDYPWADGGGGDDCTTVDGQQVCNIDDDPLYEDVNGDDTLGQDDVVTFFENQHRDAWDQPDLFDFSGNGSVGHGDVVALFEEVAI